MGSTGAYKMIYQIQYKIRGRRPTKQLIAEARTAFVNNKPMPEGVTINPIAWRGSLGKLREALRRDSAYIGDAGIVKQYAENQLSLCDFDGSWTVSLDRIRRLSEMLEIGISWVRQDRTRRGWHLLIFWKKPLNPFQLIAIQCILGSDLQREAYNLARAMSGKDSKRWNLLFERKL